MKIGVSLKIDVTKIDKSKLFSGKKGTYLDATAFINVDELDQYGNSGMITQSVEKDSGEKGAILGNAKVFWRDDGKKPSGQAPAQEGGRQSSGFDNFDDDIPF